MSLQSGYQGRAMGCGSRERLFYQLLLNGLVALLEQLFCPLQDPVLSRNFCYFQALLFIKCVLAPELINIVFQLERERTEISFNLKQKKGLITDCCYIKCNYRIWTAYRR